MTKPHRRRVAPLAILALSPPLVLVGAAASAQDAYPRLTGGFVIELENDHTFSSDDQGAEINDAFATVEAAVALEFSGATALNATLLLEPVSDAADDEDRFFEDHGLFAEELYLRHDFGVAEALIGKFNPAFGFAWDRAPGIFGADFAEDYELTERLGAAAAIPVEFGAGETVLSISAFAADRTVFSDSLIDSRGKLEQSDGGVSNTDAPESFIAAIAGETEGLAYNFGFRRQAKGAGDSRDEIGFVAGAVAAAGWADVELLGEVAYFPRFDGGPERAIYATMGVAAPVGPVTLSAVYAMRDVEDASTGHLATATVEYEIVERFSIAAGYRYVREERIDEHTVGALLVYEFGF